MNRTELVERLILNAISDDFENVDQVIFPYVAGQVAKCGLTIDRSEIVGLLGTLVAGGLVKAYDLSGWARDPFSGELQACHRWTLSRRTSEPISTSRKSGWTSACKMQHSGH